VDLYEKVFKIGDHPFFITVFHDISNKKKSEIQKENTIVFLNSVIENLPNMVFIKDAEKLSFIKINKAGERLLGISRADLLGKTDFDFFPKKQAEYFVENDKNVIKNKTTLDIAEELIETKFGSRWLHTKKIALSNNNHTPQYLLGISEDITDKKIIEKERDNALIQLKESESKLELVISNIGEGVIMTNEVQELLLYNQTATEIFETLEPKKLARWTFKFHIFYPDGNQIYPAQMLPLERALRG
ncbi:MAG: PAS domain-containing protein, partial [Bacteroidota bacterium]